MGIVLRSIKGEPLTVQEMDQNMMELDCRIKALEDLSQAETAITVENVHDSLVFKNGLGTEVGRAILPKPPKAGGLTHLSGLPKSTFCLLSVPFNHECLG